MRTCTKRSDGKRQGRGRAAKTSNSAAAFPSKTPSAMLALAAGVSGWVTISQARFGGQIDAIARQFQGQNDENTPHVQQKLCAACLPPCTRSCRRR